LHTGLANPVIGGAWPEFIQTLRDDHDDVPGEPVFRALALGMQLQQEDEAYKLTLKPFSQQDPELWRLLQHTAENLPPKGFGSAKAWFIGSDPVWAEPDTWKVIRRVAAPYTTYNLFNALDVTLTPDGNLRLKPAEELRPLLEVAGVTPDREVIAYCQTHHRSSHTYVVLKSLGYPRIKGYPGAWSEWGNLPDTPIET
jgi:rhodanese-related sulfurtransferase